MAKKDSKLQQLTLKLTPEGQVIRALERIANALEKIAEQGVYDRGKKHYVGPG